MDPFITPLIIHALLTHVTLTGTVLAVATVATLTYARIKSWFVSRSRLRDVDTIAFTLRSALAEGAYSQQTGIFEKPNTIVQGFFNTRTNELVDHKVWNAKHLDGQLAQAHAKHPLAIYT